MKINFAKVEASSIINSQSTSFVFDESEIGDLGQSNANLKIKKIKPKLIHSIELNEVRKKQLQKKRELLKEKKQKKKKERRFSVQNNCVQQSSNSNSSRRMSVDAVIIPKNFVFNENLITDRKNPWVEAEDDSDEEKSKPFEKDTFYNVEFSFQNGDNYVGGFKNKKFQGEGKFTFHNGKIIEGEWRDGQIRGKAKVTYPNGDIYIGYYRNMRKGGYGYLIYGNGERFTGHFENGQITGYGIFQKGGKVIKGFWENGKLVDEEE